MADIELVIKIPEEKFLYAKNLVDGGKETNPVVLAIGSGTPLDIYSVNASMPLLKNSKTNLKKKAKKNKKEVENMSIKEAFVTTIKEFTALTGINTSYENQGSNGKFLFFETSDNGGRGYYIGIDSYLDGIRTLEGMKNGYILAKKGKFL